MKNTLTLLAAMVRVDLVPVQSREVRRAIDRFEQRILAFDEVYRLLSVGAACGEISVGEYVGNLSRALAVAILEPIGLRCEASIEDGRLESARCERLGLIITELVTNAAKHAFPGRRRGLVRIHIRYQVGCWRCVVCDNGIGASGSSPGAGSQILEDLARSIRGHISIKSGRQGTAATVVLPD